MNGYKSPEYQRDCSFIPINLHDAAEREELQKQRKACGWHYTEEWMDKWRSQIDNKERTIFWIVLPSHDNFRAGHVSLDSLENSTDEDLRNSDRSMMTIKTFFIWPDYRKFGLGRKAMDAMEDLATKEPYGSPNCKAIVVDTVTKRYFYDPEMIEERKLWGGDFGDIIINEEWYERRGYVKWKEERTYQESSPVTGEMLHLMASFLRKDLK